MLGGSEREDKNEKDEWSSHRNASSMIVCSVDGHYSRYHLWIQQLPRLSIFSPMVPGDGPVTYRLSRNNPERRNMGPITSPLTFRNRAIGEASTEEEFLD